MIHVARATPLSTNAINSAGRVGCGARQEIGWRLRKEIWYSSPLCNFLPQRSVRKWLSPNVNFFFFCNVRGNKHLAFLPTELLNIKEIIKVRVPHWTLSQPPPASTVTFPNSTRVSQRMSRFCFPVRAGLHGGKENVCSVYNLILRVQHNAWLSSYFINTYWRNKCIKVTTQT